MVGDRRGSSHGTDRAGARPGSSGPDPQRNLALRMLIGPVRVKAWPVRPETGGQHAIEHIDPALDGADDVVRLADAHQVTRLGGIRAGPARNRTRRTWLPGLRPARPPPRSRRTSPSSSASRRSPCAALVERATTDAEDRVVCRMLLGGEESCRGCLRQRIDRSIAAACTSQVDVGRDSSSSAMVGTEQSLDLDRALGAEHVAQPSRCDLRRRRPRYASRSARLITLITARNRSRIERSQPMNLMQPTKGERRARRQGATSGDRCCRMMSAPAAHRQASSP